jgi:hypothetical protein
MKRILFLFFLLPYLATAQVAKDTVTVLTPAQITAHSPNDTANIYFVIANAWRKANFDSIARYTRTRLQTLTLDSTHIAANGLSLQGTELTGTLPVTKGGTGANTQFTAGSVVFAGASGVYSENNSRLFWNNSTNRLGINTSNPQAALHLEGGGEAMRFRGSTAGSTPFMSFYASDSTESSNSGILYRSFENNTNRYYLTYYPATNSSGFNNAFTLYQFRNIANANVDRVRMLFSDNGDFAVGKITNGSTLAGSTFVVKDGGNVGVGVAAPTAVLHLKAGTATANTAPLKFTSGTNLTTPEAGTMEYNGTNLFFTPSSTRHTINQGLTGSATLDFASTNAQNSRDLTITVTGASDGDVVSLGVPNGSVNANTCFTAWVSASNTVTVRFNNYSSGSVDPASGTFKVFVTKF